MGSIDSGKDAEAGKTKLPYPTAVLFILVCEFCERFCYYGMRTILTLYFVQVLGWDDDMASIIYHTYVVFSYFTPIAGAILADSFLGKFRTIFYLSVVYCAGCILLALSAAPPLKIPTMAFSMIGLALIAVGTGGIKPCVSAFGADQFQLPEQELQLASFFAIFYFAINSGSLISTVLTPILREDIQCFGDDHCYSLAFAIPAALMVFALVVFLVARPMYKVNDPQGNVMAQVFGAIKHSLSRKKSEVKAGRTRDHWLDYADDKYDKRFLEEAKVLLKVLFLYIPLPLFWSLFDQQGSRWTLQASRMDGDTWGWVIKPDQMQVINPLVVLALIPLFDQVFYPILAKFNLLKKPLQRLTVGGVFAGLAFVVSGIIELTLEPSYATVLKSGEANIHFVNSFPCPLSVTLDGFDEKVINPGMFEIYEAIDARNYSATLKTITTEDSGCKDSKDFSGTVIAVDKEARSYMAVRNGNDLDMIRIEEEDDMEKSDSGNPRTRVIHYGLPLADAKLHGDTEKNIFDFILDADTHTGFGEVEREEYSLSLIHPKITNGSISLGKNLNMELGAVYIISVVYHGDDDTVQEISNASNYQIGFHQITKPNNVHILLLLPQYIVMSMGEIMFSVTIMDFSYAEGPPSMKSVMQSAWLLTVAVGNVIDVIIISVKIFDQQSKEFFLFAGLMFVDMIIFSYMAYKYVPADRFWLREDNQPGEKKEEVKALEAGEDKDGNDNLALDKSE